MDCPRNEEVLSAFVDGETPASQQRAVARHVLECEKCAAETGRLLAVRSYLDVEPEEPASLGHEFFSRLHQALNLSDLIDTATRNRRSPLVVSPRLAWAATVCLALLVVVAGVAWHPASPLLAPATLAQAHESTLDQPAPETLAPAFTLHDSPMPAPAGWASPVGLSGLQPAAWDSSPALGLGSPRRQPPPVPQPRQEAAEVEQEVFSDGALIVSRFIVPEKLLDVSGWRPLTYGDDRFYAAREGATTLLAQREHGEWQLLAARASLEQLLAFAELHEAELAR